VRADVGTRSRIPTVTACPLCAFGSWPWDSNFIRRDWLPIVAWPNLSPFRFVNGRRE